MQNHSVVDVGTSRDHTVQPQPDQNRVTHGLVIRFLSISRDGGSTNALESWFQYLTFLAAQEVLMLRGIFSKSILLLCLRKSYLRQTLVYFTPQLKGSTRAAHYLPSLAEMLKPLAPCKIDTENGCSWFCIHEHNPCTNPAL